VGQTLVRNYVHIVFSTKHRQPFLTAPFDQAIYDYLEGLCLSMDCIPLKIGGHLDHVHILCNMSTKVTMAKLLEITKANSSKWAKTLHPSLDNFYWQNGYGCFSISPRAIDAVIAYIENQHAHHRNKDFKEEYRQFLKTYQIEYDERYVWD